MEASRRLGPARTGGPIDAFSVLVVDDEPAILSTIAAQLGLHGIEVNCAVNARQATRVAQQNRVDLALVDFRLDDDLDGLRLGRLLHENHGLPFVLFSGFLTPDLAFAAAKAGACGVLPKPIDGRTVVSLLERLKNDGRPVAPAPRVEDVVHDCAIRHQTASTAGRWAQAVLGASQAPADPTTMERWANSVGMSVSSLRAICRICHAGPRASRDLARFLRAEALSLPTRSQLQDHLNVADHRTLASLFRQARLPVDSGPVALWDFFKNQTFVPTHLPCLQEVCHMAANSPWFSARS